MKFGNVVEFNSATFGNFRLVNDVITRILDSHKILTSFLTAGMYVMFLCWLPLTVYVLPFQTNDISWRAARLTGSSFNFAPKVLTYICLKWEQF